MSHPFYCQNEEQIDTVIEDLAGCYGLKVLLIGNSETQLCSFLDSWAPNKTGEWTRTNKSTLQFNGGATVRTLLVSDDFNLDQIDFEKTVFILDHPVPDWHQFKLIKYLKDPARYPKYPMMFVTLDQELVWSCLVDSGNRDQFDKDMEVWFPRSGIMGYRRLTRDLKDKGFINS